MRSPAYTTLGHSARSTLTVLAVQYFTVLKTIEQANGLQMLTAAICDRYGLTYDTALRDASVLERHGLIVRTQKGRYRPAPQVSTPNCWGLAWLPVTHHGPTNLLDKTEPAPNGWKRWRPPSPADIQGLDLSDKEACQRATDEYGVSVTMLKKLVSKSSPADRCERCGQVFERARKSRRFCSSRCRTASYRENLPNANPQTTERSESVRNANSEANANATPADARLQKNVSPPTPDRPESAKPVDFLSFANAKPADERSNSFRSSPKAQSAEAALLTLTDEHRAEFVLRIDETAFLKTTAAELGVAITQLEAHLKTPMQRP